MRPAHPQAQRGWHGLRHHLGPAREENCWLQPNQQAVLSLPPGEIPHNVHTRGRHPQQEEGDLHPVHAQGQADLGQEEEEKETVVLVLVNFHFLHFHFLQCCNFENLCSLLFLPDEWKHESSASNKQYVASCLAFSC